MAERSRKKGKIAPDGRTASLERPLNMGDGEMLNALDNPDDGEIYDTGDASDFAGENRKRNLRKSQKK